MKKMVNNLIKLCIDVFELSVNFFMGQKNSACKSGLAAKSGVVKSGKTNIVKICKVCQIRCQYAVVHCTFVLHDNL